MHEESSVADTNYSSDSFDSDWNTSVASPYSTSSPVNPIQEYTDPGESVTPRATNLLNKKVSLDSQGSHYDQPYSNVEELGGGFSSFGPLPPVEFRSTPIQERGNDSDRQENCTDTATSPGSRKSFTNQLFQAVHDPKDVDLGEGGTTYEGFQEKDISGMENQGYDSDEQLDQYLANQAKPGTSTETKPKNIEDLYAKVDKSKKKTFRKKDTTSSSDSESNHSTTQEPRKLNDSYTKTDKSKKTFRKTSHGRQEDQAAGQAEESSHDPVVVYDERTNL